jgi:hypothetical protein
MDKLQCQFYPCGSNTAPVVVVGDPSRIGIQWNQPLAIHLMVLEPSHVQLLELAAQLRTAGYTRCMLMIGTITPKTTCKQSSSDLRGLLLQLDRLIGVDDGVGAYPSDAIEHGWKLCFDNAERSSLCFALNGQRPTDNGTVEVLSVATLPPLAILGLRLWRRGDVAHAIVQKSTSSSSSDWDEQIKRFLETPVE